MLGKFNLDDVKEFFQIIIVFALLFMAALVVYGYGLVAGT